MSDKDKALRLADALEQMPGYDFDKNYCEAAAELRRLSAVEAERKALFQIVEAIEMALLMGVPAFEVLRASSPIREEMQSVIAKVKGGGNG